VVRQKKAFCEDKGMSYEIFIYLLQEKKGLKEGSGNIIT
jgi:hypothetical protein